MLAPQRSTQRPVFFSLLSIILGLIAWVASFELLNEYVKTLQNPEYVPNCAMSVLVSCGPNMGAWQGSIFGFSNSIIGVCAFTAPILVGVALLADARFARWFWVLYQLGLLCGLLCVAWFTYQSIFVLHTLCPWCLVIWAVMIPLTLVTLVRPYAVGDITLQPSTKKVFESFYSWSWVIIVLCYLIIAGIAQFQLDWLAQLRRA